MKHHETNTTTIKSTRSKFLAMAATYCRSVSSLFYFSRTQVSQSGKPFIGLFMRMILSLRYSIEVKGLGTLNVKQDKGIIFLPNHPALIDPVIVMSFLYSRFEPRPLSDSDQASKPFVRQIMKFINPITLPDLHKSGRSGRTRVKEALNEVAQCLRDGEQIIMYPAGRLYRSAKETLAGNSGVETVLKNAPDVQVVLVKTSGLWGSSFSRASGETPSLTKHLKRYLQALLTNGIFFSPRRKVTVELVQDTKIATLGNRRAINGYLENFYNSGAQKNTDIPYFWWQRRSQQILSELV